MKCVAFWNPYTFNHNGKHTYTKTTARKVDINGKQFLKRQPIIPFVLSLLIKYIFVCRGWPTLTRLRCPITWPLFKFTVFRIWRSPSINLSATTIVHLLLRYACRQTDMMIAMLCSPSRVAATNNMLMSKSHNDRLIDHDGFFLQNHSYGIYL